MKLQSALCHRYLAFWDWPMDQALKSKLNSSSNNNNHNKSSKRNKFNPSRTSTDQTHPLSSMAHRQL
jgi:hypothetical protein